MIKKKEGEGKPQKLKCSMTLLSLCMIVGLSNSAYALIAPFQPIYMASIGGNKDLNGYIFSTYSLAVILCSPVIGFFLRRFRRRNFVQMGLFCMGLAMLGFAVASWFSDRPGLYIFYGITFATRFLQGFSSSAIQTTAFSASGQLFAQHQAQAIAWMEIACGLGMTVAPPLGSALYEWGGYAYPFYGIGALFLVMAIIIKLVVPKAMDARIGEKTDEDDGSVRVTGAESIADLRETYQNEIEPEEDEYSQSSNENDKPNIGRLLLKPAIFFGCFTGALGFLTYSQQEPILAERIAEFNYSGTQRGVFFAIQPIAYLVGGIGTQFQPRHVDLRVFIIVGALLNGVAMLCNGPSAILNFPNSDKLIIAGQIMNGLALSQLNVLALPEMMKQANLAFPGYEEEVSNLCSGIFNSALGMGQITGPILGNKLTNAYNFQFAEDVVAMINISWALLYLVLAGGCMAFKSLTPSYKKKWLEEQKSLEAKE